jgi:pilus assembly protein CpaF
MAERDREDNSSADTGGFIPDYERIVVIGDTPELHSEPNIVAWIADEYIQISVSRRPVEDALRFRPDRLSWRSPKRGAALLMFNTGHSGSLATIHANSAEKALCRFANLVMRGHAQTTFSDTEAEIAEAVDFVVHVERQPGRRTVREVLRLNGYDRRTEQFRFEPVYGGETASISGFTHA